MTIRAGRRARAAGVALGAAISLCWLLPGLGARPAGATTTKTTAAATGDESVAYQVDAMHDGHLSGGVEAPPLTQKWSRDLGGLISYPIITGGRVFVTARSSGSEYGTYLYALDSATGNNAWGPIPLSGIYYWSALAAGGGQLFVLNYSGLLRAFNPSTGAQQWIVQLPGQYSFTSPPTYLNGIVYSGGAGSGGTVYANRASDGALLWTAPVANGDDSSPAVSSTGVYVSYACAQTYDFDPITGSQIWHYSTYCEGGGGRTPVLADGQLWVRDWATSPVVLNAATGMLANGFSGGPAPAFDGARGFFLEGGVLHARDAGSLAPLWSFTGDATLVSAPIVVNGFVYEASASGVLWALDEMTGQQVWSANTGSPIRGPDEQNVSQPLTGLAAGQGLVVVPASNLLVAYQGSTQRAPSITSAAAATFTVGAAGSFTVTAVGAPNPRVSESGALPAGVAFDGATATLAGSPAQGTTGSYPITLSATNGVGADATENFTLTVNQATMSYPSDAQANVDTTVPFTWSTIAQAQGYRLIVGTNTYGSDLVDSAVVPASTSSYTLPTALPSGPTLHATLFAEVNSTWTSYQATTFTAAPGQATFTFPLDGQLGVDPTRAFSWSTIPQSQGSILVVGTGRFGSNLVNSGVLPSTQSRYITPVLPAGQTLYATLLTKVNGAYTRAQTITFTTGAADGSFTHPLDGQRNLATPTAATWATIAGAQNYWLVIGTTIYGTNLVNSGLLPASQSSFNIGALPKGQTLFATLLTKVNGKWAAQVIGFTAS